ncbi:Pa domain-containing protein [Colletotrichum higginsianum IMI 349063]|uniref:Pa domain-containing protein n=2 Tax=Colletotrichum higginsianum TaxID=80884 RepID=A0A1B7Y168_COLHI|nr:Pa domain-containing protein [Colletotrichum higginsianum IMI 349063]OBR05766.1 Pa domain-containing protein [Colletotrichum higginsianum IMI 349063]TIC90631.1 E3 ubiquitin-protein ligase RNF13 [Colletotrichum higginsianum]
MRTPRLAILVFFFVASLFLFCRSVFSSPRQNIAVAAAVAAAAPAAVPPSRFQSLFSFNAPFSIFTPNAAITLTDDNSTSFVARPAAFGPNLPNKGLSGQLWIGSGFSDDNLQEGEGEGELGCTDIPGWENGRPNAILKSAAKAMSKADAKPATAAGKPAHHKRGIVDADKDALPAAVAQPNTRLKSKIRPLDDGTDDYLHQGLARKPTPHRDSAMSTESTHADIQSIQEAAEIAGKIVLLSRGGCGFLEKAKWAQRRGAIALIVGDNTKGGPLIQMFARGDTSNVSIPSVFTTRTTAHLLSSLTQPGSFIEDTIDEHGRPALKVLHSDGANRKNRKNKQKAAATTPTPTPKATATPKAKAKAAAATKDKAAKAKQTTTKPRVGFFRWLFSWGRSSGSGDGSIQPPTSGRHNWVLVDDWNEAKDRSISDSLGKAAKRGKDKAPEPSKNEDSFQIGVQDWRDPDLVDAPSTKDKDDKPERAGRTGNVAKAAKDLSGPKGGSITPGSGEYNPDMPPVKAKGPASSGKDSSSHGGIMSKIFGDDDGADFSKEDKPQDPPAPEQPSPDDGHEDDDDDDPIGHDGLWVTITPSSSSSPFFDTLLVLVVSPLITLSVVYALLILRARIRRRRWRAPKSVVERLPVRTYHTVAASPVPSPRIPSPTIATPTTPLLQQTPTRPRPRSRTTTGIPESESLLSVNAALQMPRSPLRPEHEKPNGSYSSEWKKYMGRQVECVVCLEEYVDGVSRVMSLPCGHEFHAECITPWLTTRRRTCPICKGDVVRSLARGSPSSPRYEAYHDDSDDEVEAEASSSRDRGDDVEQGILSPAPRGRQTRPDGWLGMLSGSFGASSRASRSPQQDDRNR